VTTSTMPLRTSDAPGVGWWLLLAIVLALGFAVHPLAGLGLLLLVAVQAMLPLDALGAYLMVVTGASFINYSRGQLTAELALLSIGLVFMLVCYVLTPNARIAAVPRTPMTLPLLLYTGLSLVNFARGVVTGNSLRYAGLEILAALALASAFHVANRMTRDRIPLAVGWLWVTGLAESALGFYIYSIIKVRTASIYFTPVPGVIELVFFNFALRARTLRAALLWTLASLPLLLHQFLSFTRGFWMGIIAGVLFSIVWFIGRRGGALDRARRVGAIVAFLVVGGVLGAIVLSITYGIHGLGGLALSRLVSSAGTHYSYDTSSNIVRLVEYGHVLGLIAQSPVFGHGLGYFFVVREPIHMKLLEQWFCHENYLLVWLKQGLIGLALFVWTIVGGLFTGIKASRSEHADISAWGAATAAASIHILTYCLVHFPLAEVNTTFTMALLWGGSMAFASTGWRSLVWRRRTAG
jgi:O-antigen ligase